MPGCLGSRRKAFHLHHTATHRFRSRLASEPLIFERCFSKVDCINHTQSLQFVRVTLRSSKRIIRGICPSYFFREINILRSSLALEIQSSNSYPCSHIQSRLAESKPLHFTPNLLFPDGFPTRDLSPLHLKSPSSLISQWLAIGCAELARSSPIFMRTPIPRSRPTQLVAKRISHTFEGPSLDLPALHMKAAHTRLILISRLIIRSVRQS